MRHQHLSRTIRLLPLAVAGLALAACASTPSAAAPTATVTATPSASPSASGTPVPWGSGPGCPAGGGGIPSGAQTAQIGDADGDGKPDTEFYTQSAPYAYGIQTASGATITLKDDLAGPGSHSGWTSHRETAVVTVIDDGRTAHLYAFVDCGFTASKDASGKPYTFTLAGYGQYGTGVECTDENGGALLFGVLAAKQPDGTYSIQGTDVNLVDGGRTAENAGSPQTLASGLAQSDPQVALANRSSCGDVPIVHTEG
jgi:hypothetical protein